MLKNISKIFKFINRFMCRQKSINIFNKKYSMNTQCGVGNSLKSAIITNSWSYDLYSKIFNYKNNNICFLDIGANIGQTLLIVKSANPQIVYYGFEPNPTCINFLNNLLELNNFSETYVFPVALAEKTEILELLVAKKVPASPGATLVEDLRPAAKDQCLKKFVPAFSFKDIKSRIHHEMNFIKIDVEGFEYEVLSSLQEQIMLSKPIILCEILWASKTADIKVWQDKLNRIEALIEKLGYKKYRVEKSADLQKVTRLTPIEKIETKTWSRDNADECDYLIISSENKDIISLFNIT